MQNIPQQPMTSCARIILIQHIRSLVLFFIDKTFTSHFETDPRESNIILEEPNEFVHLLGIISIVMY